MHVLILQWSGSGNDCLRGFLQFARRELEADGHKVQALDIEDPQWGGKLHEMHGRERLHLALGMSGLGSDAYTQDRRLLWEVIQLPYFSWNCDHPAYFPARHTIRNPFLLHGYVFPDHARFAAESLRVNGATFAVHMGIPARAAFPGAALALARRNGRILFSKTGGDVQSIESRWKAMASPLREVLFDASEELAWRGSVTDAFPVARRIAAERGLLIDAASAVAMTLVREIDNLVRTRRADLVVNALLDYPVDVYGSGWDHIAWDGRRARRMGPAPWREIVAAYPSYTACLSVNPMVEESVHDRSFYGLAANVTPIADSNAFSREYMPELEDYAFRFDPVSIAAAVDHVLALPAQALERTEACWERLRTRFSMAESMRQIVSFGGMAALNGLTCR